MASLKGKDNPAYIHGDAKRGAHSGEYYSWSNMRRRCDSPKNNRFKYYGGRGIKVCDRWKTSFIAFLQDMGRRPSSAHSIDRINTNGNYTPENCRWATRIEQAQTRSSTLDFDGKSLRQKCLELGIAYKAAHFRFKHGQNPLLPLRRSKHNVK